MRPTRWVRPSAWRSVGEGCAWFLLLGLSIGVGLRKERPSPKREVAERRDTWPANPPDPPGSPNPIGDVAVASSVGTRLHQEDAFVLLEVPEAFVLVVADGMGGHPGGGRASAIATSTMSRVLCRELATLRDVSPDLATGVLRAAFVAAAEALQQEAVETGLETFGTDVLRTTTLVLIATCEHFVAGGIGDGVVLVRRADDGLEALFEVTDKIEQHLVGTSLGPTVHGSPKFAMVDRGRGDLAIIATDGICDRVTASFYEGLHLGFREGGSAEDMVNEAMAVVRESPDTFDDNATLGLVWTGLE